MENFKNQQTQKIEGVPGQHISDFARQLIDTAKAMNKEVMGTFNDIDLVVNPELNLSVDDLIQVFRREREKKAEEYRKSPEGIRLAKEEKATKQRKQEKANQLVEALKSMDFSDYESILEWFCDFQEVSDYIGVSFDKDQVILTFKNHGFDVEEKMKKSFDRDDAENFAKYIIKQSLDGINTVGAPHQVVHRFTNDWKRKFGKQKQSDAKRIEELKKGL